jgi:hypothetical protein
MVGFALFVNVIMRRWFTYYLKAATPSAFGTWSKIGLNFKISSPPHGLIGTNLRLQGIYGLNCVFRYYMEASWLCPTFLF